MRKTILVLSIAALLAAGAAFAQGTRPSFYGGVSIGLESAGGLAAFPIGVHFGVEDLGLQNLVVRGDFAYWLGGFGAGVMEAGIDGLYQYPITSAVSVYGGLGPRLLILGGNGVFGLGVVAGGEYLVTPHVGVTAEADVTPYFGSGGSATFFNLTAGVNYHF